MYVCIYVCDMHVLCVCVYVCDMRVYVCVKARVMTVDRTQCMCCVCVYVCVCYVCVYVCVYVCESKGHVS